MNDPSPKVGNQTGRPWRVHDDVRTLCAQHVRPGYHADATAVATFQRDGVVLLPNAFTDWVEPLQAGLEENLRNPKHYAFPCDSASPSEPGRFFDSYCNWQLIPQYEQFVLTSQAAAMAAAFMESSTAQFFHDHAFCKEPRTQKATPWHHDLPYYCVDGTQTVSIYVALDDIGEETAVRFLKGSHETGQLYHPRNFSEGAEYGTADTTMVSAPNIDDDVSGQDIFCAALSPGDALLFDFRTLHGSTNAEVKTRRRAFSTRWLGDDVVYIERKGETSPPLTDLNVTPGQRMRTDWFPELWPNP